MTRRVCATIFLARSLSLRMRWHEITGEVERKLLLRDKNVFLKTFGFHFKGPEEPLELSLPLLEH
jgi:hypothetical protein